MAGEATEKSSWCVVGGGMLGLTLAWRLAEAGHPVTLVEAAPYLGGLASAWQLGDVTWDRHYHVTLLSDTRLRRILSELDLDQDMCWTITQTGFFAKGRLHRLNNAIDYLRFPPLALPDKVRLAATIFYISKIQDGRRLEALRLDEWLTRLSGRRVFETIWRPLLRAKLGDNYTKASASFIWAVVRRLYAARETGLKEEMFGYLPGGYARILDRFAERLTARGVTLRLGCPVERIERVGQTMRVKTVDGEAFYDQVAVTLAAPQAARVCAGLNDDELARLAGIEYQGIICASVLLKQPLSPYYLTYITDDAVPFTAVVDMTALVDPAHLGGRGLIYLPKYVTADDSAWALDDGRIETLFRAGLARIYPNFKAEDVEAFRISRVRQVLAISTLNYSDRLPPMQTSVPGLAIVNSAHIINGTLNVNETVALAEDAAPRLLAAARTAQPETRIHAA